MAEVSQITSSANTSRHDSRSPDAKRLNIRRPTSTFSSAIARAVSRDGRVVANALHIPCLLASRMFLGGPSKPVHRFGQPTTEESPTNRGVD